MHRPPRRQGRQELPGVGRLGRRIADHDRRGARTGRRAVGDPGGILGGVRDPGRIRHPGRDDVRGRPALAKPRSNVCRDPGLAGRQPLPRDRLPQPGARGSCGGEPAQGRQVRFAAGRGQERRQGRRQAGRRPRVPDRGPRDASRRGQVHRRRRAPRDGVRVDSAKPAWPRPDHVDRHVCGELGARGHPSLHRPRRLADHASPGDLGSHGHRESLPPASLRDRSRLDDRARDRPGPLRRRCGGGRRRRHAAAGRRCTEAHRRRLRGAARGHRGAGRTGRRRAPAARRGARQSGVQRHDRRQGGGRGRHRGGGRRGEEDDPQPAPHRQHDRVAWRRRRL